MNDESGTAFLDLASNLLAVVLIVTLFSLLSLRSATRQVDDPLPRQDPTLPFDTPQRVLFPPFSRFYLLLDDAIRPWREETIIEQLLDDPGRYNSLSAAGRYQWQGDDRGGRDVDVYQLRFWPASDSAASDDQPLEDWLAALWRDYQELRSAPVFVVYPSGMDRFAQLYSLLEEHGLPFRWFTLEEGEPLHVGRFPAQFLDHGIYW